MPRELRDNRLVEVIYGVETWTPSLPTKAQTGNAKLPKAQQKFALGPFDPKKFEPTRFDQKKFDALPADEQREFVLREWTRRREGYWLMINGELTWLPGGYYFELVYWHIDIGLKEYRDRDRRKWLFWHTCAQNPRCFGVIYMKHRRDGATFWAGCINYETISRTKRAVGGIQSKTGKDSNKVFQKAVVSPFRLLPPFFQPIFDGNDKPKMELSFSAPSQRQTKNQKGVQASEAIESSIDHRPTVEDAYDGQKLIFYHGDEWGKCHRKDTPILMFDGTVKMVQDVEVGDLLMGDDSTSREVLSLARGRDQMYEVVPNKGMAWGCNEEHILSLKASADRCVPGLKKNDTFNISVKDFLRLPAKSQKHLMLYRVPVEYPTKDHFLDPYFLGVWLGDGSHRTANIAAADPETTAYLEGFAASHGLLVRRDGPNGISHHITSGKINGKNPVLKALGDLGLRGNKHIPQEYLIDSRENRLRLLAGLIDSDGYKNGEGRYQYEITQKRENLALDIQRLAQGLGFSASCGAKRATMRRKDGSLYESQVFRVHIYGDDLHQIPCLIPRKKLVPKVERHKNTRNPLRSGFKLRPEGEGDYYGFTISGNHLYLLGDCTVTHNTVEMKVSKAWPIIRECLSVGAGTKIMGNALITSTVAEGTKKGGNEFKKIWDDSDPLKLDKTHATLSGLFRLFLPASDGMEGFIGEYGESIIDAPTQAQLAYLRKKNPDFPYQEGMGAQAFLLMRRQELRDAGNADGLAENRRQYPLDELDAFTPPAQECLFDAMKLDAQSDTLRMEKVKRVVRGEFVPADVSQPDGDVRFVPKPNGNWYVNKKLVRYDEATGTCLGYEHANRYIRRGDIFLPANKTFGKGGVDPVEHEGTTDEIRASKFAMALFRKFDSLDPDNSHKFIARYVHRAGKRNLMYEDGLLALKYFGIECLIENQKPGFENYLKERGYYAYSMPRPKHTHTKNTVNQKARGIPASDLAHVEIHDEWEAYICDHWEKIDDEEFIHDLKGFDINDTRKYDLVMAGGYGLIGARSFRPASALGSAESRAGKGSYVRTYG